APRGGTGRLLAIGAGLLLVATFLVYVAPRLLPAPSTRTGPMASIRREHSATMLPGGRVLVAGGAGASAEVYDPGSNAWRTVAPMGAERSGHAAAPLPDGRVLVAGGSLGFGGEPLATAEVYDPAADAWRPVASMILPRAGHTATPLADGRILVVGGRTQLGGYLARAEVYDPVADRWNSTEQLADRRGGHTATLLPDGRVLVAGGLSGVDANGPVTLAGTEIYDPKTNGWTSTGALGRARRSHAAAPLPDGRVLAVGGLDAGGVVVAAEVYDPVAGEWRPVPGGDAARFRTAVPLPDGRVFLTEYATGDARGAAGLYDSVSGQWEAVGRLVVTRNLQTVTPLPDGRVLIAGGSRDAADGAEVYNPAAGRWRLPWSR
ncbi:MAG: hypothetical protein AVDCRST_MAG88-4453, partial [uncultured Thermomicrobiales bacterium]